MKRIDLHVHTRRYSNCAEFLFPEELGRGMLQAKLDGVVITEHDAQWLPDEQAELRRSLLPHRVFFGIEISATDGHVIGIGIPAGFCWRRDHSVQQIAGSIDAAGGCSVWVHPYQAPRRWIEPPRNIHAVEIYSTVTVGEYSLQAQRLAKQLGVFAVAGSDAHALDHLATAWIEFDGLPQDEQQLAQWIRLGRGQPYRR